MGKMIPLAEGAERKGVSLRRMQQLCKQRRIAGARLIGKVWMLPEDFEITPGKPGRPKAK